MVQLTESQYRATMDPHPVRVDQDSPPPFDFWPYFDSIDDSDLDGHDFSAGVVTHAWTMPISNHQHVLISCETPNVFLVLVLDLRHDTVYGHHLLDLRVLYGLS
ncbi:hypothetical protein ACFP2T_26270 [Plantactinospora solaniradicis]|uniref:Uncharacterized protein n=1 Tax=Plantactinospora solaniradicis TaxID=1723736 RepID=A0ABW1KE18_9ACTN